AENAETVPIGPALTAVTTHVLDQDLSPVAPGDCGDLYIGGAGVTRGYAGQAALTAERFLADPFAADGSRMYATGDRVRLGDNGVLEFLGRADRQVKIRGYRVELAEVERMLCRHPDVREAAVLAVGNGQDRSLAAFVVRRSSLRIDELRAYCEATAPDFMVPGVIVVTPEIPANDHGKRDWAAMEAGIDAERTRRAAYTPPATEAERLLARIWTDLLAVEQAGAEDDFFVLGGNSMLAFRVQRRIQRETGTTVDFADILTCSVLRDLAHHLDRSPEPRMVP
ncbi:phosphopantetheine-binding protein, partial [Streptomyces decoyicus]|uniref:phosphopantetheine-binding protein n=1 Tax=Streptomyces decoyicus TaxID=249567 RepID=UPI0033BC06DA